MKGLKLKIRGERDNRSSVYQLIVKKDIRLCLKVDQVYEDDNDEICRLIIIEETDEH